MFSLILFVVLVQTPVTNVRVYDGDTIIVNIPNWPPIIGYNIGVRISGIDTPELSSKSIVVRTWAYSARDYLAAKIAAAKTVELGQLRRDKYFRILAPVLIDGVDIAPELIKLGYAKPYDGRMKKPWAVSDVPRKPTKVLAE